MNSRRNRARALSLALAALALSAVTPAETLHVPGDYATIAEAVAAAASGDTIEVGPGTHVAVEVSFGGKNLKLHGDGAETTVLDAQSSGRHLIFDNGEDSSSRVRGFTLTNGSGLGGGSIRVSGASPRIEECVFENNVTGNHSAGNGADGGAVRLIDSGTHISDCSFVGNGTADGAQPTSGNGRRAGHGGAIAISESTCEVLRCTFDGNTVGDGSSAAPSGGIGGVGGRGSALWIKNTDPATDSILIEDCRIENGTAGLGGPGVDAGQGAGGNGGQGAGGNGGLVYARVGSADRLTFDGCIVRNGSAGAGDIPGNGGGFFLRVDDEGVSDGPAISVVNSAFSGCSADSGASGGAIHADVNASAIALAHVTISGCSAGTAGAVSADAPGFSLHNSIVWNSGITPLVGVEANYCDVEGGYPGAFNIDSDPLLDVDGIHLQETSPCVDAGSPSLVGIPAEDFDGDPRGSYGYPDVGADELSSVVRVPGDYGTVSIQDAVALVAPGGRVLVGPGTYQESNINFQGKQLELVSEAGPEQTTIDAQGNNRHFVFDNGEGPTTVLEGFTLKRGYSNGNSGGSVRIEGAAPTLRNLVFFNNESRGSGHHGGALSVRNTPDETTCLVDRCVFESNTTTSGGAGVNGGAAWVNNAHVSFKGCEFTENSASPMVTLSATVFSVAGKGGAVFASGSGPLSFEDCTFRSNIAGTGSFFADLPETHDGDGGALYINASVGDVSVDRCLFDDNNAGFQAAFFGGQVLGDGGSIYYNDASDEGRLVVRSSAFLGGAARRGAAVYINGPSQSGASNSIVQTTFRDSTATGSGAAVFGQGARIALSNCIVWPNPSTKALKKSGGGSFTTTYSAVSEPNSGAGNLFDDPLFEGNSGYALASDSPCIDAGDGAASDLPAFDLDGHPVGCTPVDMGADETGFAAEQHIRAGMLWPNPLALQPGSVPPIQGTTWNPSVDHSSFAPTAVTDFLAISFGSIEVPYGAGSLLVDPSSLLTVEFAVPGASFEVPIPTACNLVGVALFTQGGSADATGGIELTNAIDLVLGEQ